MAFLRPEAVSLLYRWREAIAAATIVCLGLWVVSWGGPFFAVLGGAIGLIGAGLGLLAVRRVRFFRGAGAPGVVEVIEGQIGYFGPLHGGYVALAELSELSLVAHLGQRAWRLSQPDGTILFIPIAAEGAEALFDAFAGLPGLDTHTLIAALDGPEVAARIVWRRHRPRRLR
ncbi:hypothetical protein U879_01020 [Defluviimonas sp. 20V17]|uniref:Uncharacterized protein n=1 Tax=Allgaiera indica TaxID=765699 RepID=A0AAN5A0J1_9RHOB|nr:hypothetical protein [Allgaiera indica]KDB05542.1 hypothetical protein U879_01020 [Defluviimonas sp. 20V17]GHE03567.1 hypothetical protein GCM10008024_27440 [Allgaiera indica]SDX44162.1 hypothetical protein SAMN05444006_11653 [Allgaiera indica]